MKDGLTDPEKGEITEEARTVLHTERRRSEQRKTKSNLLSRL